MWSSFGWKAWTFCLFVEEHWHGVHIQIFFCVVCLHWNGTGIVFMRTPGLRSETSLVNQEQQAEFLFLSAIPVLFSDLFVRTWKSGQNRSCWQKPRFFFQRHWHCLCVRCILVPNSCNKESLCVWEFCLVPIKDKSSSRQCEWVTPVKAVVITIPLPQGSTRDPQWLPAYPRDMCCMKKSTYFEDNPT